MTYSYLEWIYPLSGIRKSEFARECNVSAPRLSQWISSGKIDGKAIVAVCALLAAWLLVP